MNTVYCIVLFVSIILSTIGTKLNKKEKHKPIKFFLWIIIIFLVIISGFRDLTYIGGDEHAYRITFEKILNNGFEFNLDNKEIGFKLLIYVLSLISDNSQILIFICALITNVLILLTLYKYSKHFTFSLFLYITLGMYFSSFNIMRQYLAIAICFWAIRYVLNRKFIKYLLCILIASSIHISALILIPMYFLVNLKILEKKYFLVLGVSILIAISFDKVMEIWGNISDENLYSNYVAWYFSEQVGVNIIRIIVNILPVIFMLILRKSFINNRNNSKFLYYSIVSTGILIISYNFIYVARLAAYFGIFNTIMIPELINSLKNRKTKNIIFMLVIIFYILWGFIDNSRGIPVFYLFDMRINQIFI